MAITLGDLKTYCREIASPDSAGNEAVREFLHWINAAIQRVYSETGWSSNLKERKLLIPVEETGTTLGVTQGSLAITLSGAETFDSKYVSEVGWELHVDGEGDQSFSLASIDDSPTNQQATMSGGDEWTQATADPVDYAFVRTKIPLPNNAKRIHRVQILQTGLEVIVLQPHEFDHEKSYDPSQRGTYPRFCTFRDGNLELWPHPGPTYVKLGISYQQAPVTLADDDLDTVEIDWPEEWRDLLLKAILLEASITQGDGSPIKYEAVLVDYLQRLKAYTALNTDRSVQTGPLGTSAPRPVPRTGRPGRSWSWTGTLIDD